MAIIKNKDIYDHSKSELPKLINELSKLLEVEKSLVEEGKKLSSTLQKVNKTNNGQEAEKLVNNTEKLNNATIKLNEVKLASVRVNEQILKAQKSLAESQTKEAVEIERLNLKRAEQKRINKELAKELNAVEKGYKKNVKSIDNLRKANKELTKERNALNLETQEGITRLAEINKQLDENNKIIKENSDSLAQQKIGIGGYADGIREVLPGMAGMVSGIKQMTLAALKFIATPIGAVITAIVVVLKSLQGAFNRSLASQEKLNKITGKLNAAFGVLLDALIPVVDFILDEVIKAFENMGKAATYVIDKLEKWGIISEETADKVSKSMDKSTSAADRLAAAERNLAVADINLQKLQLKYQTLAEKQRQIRDDESRSIEERIEANKRLGEILDKQAQAEKAQAEQVLQIAKDRQLVNGESIESIREIGEAEIKLLEITERIESQRSEQLVNTNSLLKEQSELYSKIAEDRAKDLENAILINQRKLQENENVKNQTILDMDAITAATRKNQQEQQDEILKTKEKYQELAQNVQGSAMAAGEQLGLLMSQGLLTFKSFGKILLLTTLDIVQKQINIYMAGILAREFFSKGLVGLATAAVMTGLVNGLFQAAKAGIQQFADGEIDINGKSHAEGGILAEIEGGESVINKSATAKSKNLLEAINNGLITDKNYLGLTGNDANMLIAGLLMNNNKTSKQMLNSLLNLGFVYERNGQTIIQRSDGTIEKFKN